MSGELVRLADFNSIPAPPGGTRRRVTLADFAPWYESAADLLAEPDPGPTPFLVEGLIVDAAVAAIQGPPKVGKTWLVLDLAVAIVTGFPVLGLNVPVPGPTLVVLEESGRAALHRRLGQLTRGKAIRPEALRDLHFAANKGVRLDESEWPERIVEAATKIQARAIFLDPLARIKGASVDENSQREIGPVLDALRDLRERTGAAVVFVHHTPHGGGHLRGSSDIEATWESKLSLSREEDGNCAVEAEHREAESGPKLRYRLSFDHATESVRLAVIEESDAEAGRAVELRQAIEDYLSEHPDASANQTFEVLRDAGSGAKRKAVLDAYKAARAEDGRLLPSVPDPVPAPGYHRVPPAQGHPRDVVPPVGHTPEGCPPGTTPSPGGTGPASTTPEPEAIPVPGDFAFTAWIFDRHKRGHLTEAERDQRLWLHLRIREASS